MTPLPEGFGLVLDPSVRSFRDGTVLVGGHPGRLIVLTAEGAGQLDAVLAGGPATSDGRRLAGRLVGAGMAHPRPSPSGRAPAAGPTVTVVVPVRDRPALLERCLRSLGTRVPVMVVDDGSTDPAAVAEVCDRYRAGLITRATSGGPGAARNEALSVVDTDLVAFVDSDCTVTEEWLDRLAWLFTDPGVGAVAPRVRPDPSGRPARRSGLDRFSDGHCALDMGGEESEVGPGRVVRYVPTAALVVRRTAMTHRFDPGLQVGEDVDLVWRLLESGWRVRYVPSTTVHHREPSSWGELLARRFRYGTSAGPLARRHPGRLAPVELRPAPTAVVVAALAGRPRTALAVMVASSAALARQTVPLGIPLPLTLRWSAQSAGWTAVGIGHASTMLAAPVLALAALRSRRAACIAAGLTLAPAAVDWWRRRPDLDPGRWCLASIADDVAYGLGVWTGCLRSGSYGPLIPAVRLRAGSGQE